MKLETLRNKLAGRRPGAWRGPAAAVAAPAGILLVLATTGPFGTFAAMALGERFAYWAAALALGGAICAAPCHLAQRRWGGQQRFAPLAVALAALVGLVPLGLAIHALNQAFGHGTTIDLAGFMARFLMGGLPLGIGIALLLNWVTWRAFDAAKVEGSTAATAAVGPAAADRAAPASADQPCVPEATAFYQRVPAGIAGPLLALEMEDHYLRIHTERGSDLILLRMKDAAAELAGSDGLQVHRSYWVAARAVTAVTQEGGRMQLHLSNGLIVPVSRSKQAAVRAAGWVAAPPGAWPSPGQQRRDRMDLAASTAS